MSPSPELGTGGKVPLALSLTAVGGFVDAVGYIVLFQIFTANMSGNSIHVGMFLAHRNWADLARNGCAIASYFVGLMATRIAIEAAGRTRWKHIASLTLGVEALLLALFARATPALRAGQMLDLRSAQHFLLIAMLAFAMGTQAATLTRVGALTVYTTFVTGTLTKLSQSLTRVVFWFHDERSAAGMSHSVRQLFAQSDTRDSLMLMFTWGCYVLGAALGTVLSSRWNLRSLYVPVAALAVVILLDQFRPSRPGSVSRALRNTPPTGWRTLSQAAKTPLWKT